LTCLLESSSSPERRHLADVKVTAERRGILATDPYQCADNLILDDWRAIAEELEPFSALGGRTIVELSSRSIGPYPLQLEQLARTTGVNIIVGTGFYIAAAHPEWVESSGVDELAEFMTQEITEGIDGTGIKAGVIGEIGTSAPILPSEIKVLQAAAGAHKQTGAAINVHLSIFKREGHKVLDILESSGVDLGRVVLSHIDEGNDFEYASSLAQRGAFIELDTFGSEFYFDQRNQREPADFERIDLLLRLLDAGWQNRVLLSQDICCKIHLLKFGGFGFAHLLRTIVPRLKRRGVGEEVVKCLLVDNPARLLGGVDVSFRN